MLWPAIVAVIAARQEPTMADIVQREEARAAEQSDYYALSAAMPEDFSVDKRTTREAAGLVKKPLLNSHLKHDYDQDAKARRAAPGPVALRHQVPCEPRDCADVHPPLP